MTAICNTLIKGMYHVRSFETFFHITSAHAFALHDGDLVFTIDSSIKFHASRGEQKGASLEDNVSTP